MKEPQPVWVPDSDVASCMKCNNRFSMLRRRHHCRRCGGIFCYKCSKSIVQGKRMCRNCRSVFLTMTDMILTYLTSYLSEKDQTSLLQTCKRLTHLAALPFVNISTPIDMRYRRQHNSSLHQLLGCSFYSDAETGCLRSLRTVDKGAVFSRYRWKQLLTESQLLLSASHACIQNVFEIFQSHNKIFFVTEPLEGVTLETVLKLQKNGVSEGVAASITRQLLQATQYLFDKLSAVVHSYNLNEIYVSLDGTVKLTRLLSSQVMDSQQLENSFECYPFGCVVGSCNSSFSNYSEGGGWSNSVSCSSLGCCERRGLPTPSPVSIPGGGDIDLLRKSQLLSRAAEERRANTALEGCFSLSVSPCRSRSSSPIYAEDVYQIGSVLHHLLTGQAFISESVSSSLWMFLSDAASVTVSLMLSPSPCDRPTPRKLLSSFEWLASGKHLASLTDFVDSFLRFAVSSDFTAAAQSETMPSK
eukprot:TRINITY_DN2062_c0_g1_i1.p1 TRINITY_DN2062_c0_g1~~TRINITY_DN2062_c0_g1_i1.p1  ORF type:complete len:471 (+),score=80.13 TRINITY_DN2062_c0_g1_i1:93-1505(+)